MGTGMKAVDILEEIGFERDSRVPYKLASTLPTGYQKRLELARYGYATGDHFLRRSIFRSEYERNCRHAPIN